MKHILCMTILLLLTNILLAKDNANDINPLEQSSASLRYSVLIKPTVSVFFDKKNKKKLVNVSPLLFGIIQDYPINKYLTAGFIADLGVLTYTAKNESHTGLLFGLLGLLRPRIPIEFSTNTCLVFYSNLELGLISLEGSPIQFYKGYKTQHIPASGLCTNIALGTEYIFNPWLGIYLESGLKYVFIHHRLSILSIAGKPTIDESKIENKEFFYHDLVALPVSIGVRFFI